MKYSKEQNTEVKKFWKEFPRSKKIPIKLEANTNGDIISIETKDKDVIKWVKENLNELKQV
jgi:hypothetical protein|tara:strand:+ start:569 stop:751 length:183 start_codon:yes stop_codon:yes gene_type:complete